MAALPTLTVTAKDRAQPPRLSVRPPAAGQVRAFLIDPKCSSGSTTRRGGVAAAGPGSRIMSEFAAGPGWGRKMARPGFDSPVPRSDQWDAGAGNLARWSRVDRIPSDSESTAPGRAPMRPGGVWEEDCRHRRDGPEVRVQHISGPELRVWPGRVAQRGASVPCQRPGTGSGAWRTRRCDGASSRSVPSKIQTYRLKHRLSDRAGLSFFTLSVERCCAQS